MRKYLIARAKAEGWPISTSWNADGSTASTSTTSGRSAVLAPNDSADLMAELRATGYLPHVSSQRRQATLEEMERAFLRRRRADRANGCRQHPDAVRYRNALAGYMDLIR